MNTVITHNLATLNGGGIYSLGTQIEIENSQINKNIAQVGGGGIFIEMLRVIVDSSGNSIPNEITGNSAYYGGGVAFKYDI